MRQSLRALWSINKSGKAWWRVGALTVGGMLCCGAARSAPNPTGALGGAAPNSHFTVSAPTIRMVPGKGYRLEGGAVFTSPQFDVRAPRMNVDTAGARTPTHVSAQGGVNFKMELGDKVTPAHFEGRSDTADLDVAQNTLVLKGNLDGWYQVAGGQPDKLRGSQATLTIARPNLKIEVEGGPDGVRFEFAPDTPKPAPVKKNPPATHLIIDPAGNNAPLANGQNNGAKSPAQLGIVVVTAQRATINAVLNNAGGAPVPVGQSSGTTGTARFIGNARAVSAEGPQHFDIAAPEFVLTRGTAGALDNLKTAGRTQLKIDFPPAPNGAAQPEPAATASGALAPANAAKPPAFGTPTHVEADADVVTLQPALSQATLQGNITGFYRLTSETGEAQEFNFSGADSVVLKNVSPQDANDDNPAGLHVDALGKPGQPVTIETPGLDINMDKTKTERPKGKR